MQSFFFFAVLAALAGRALAFTQITVGLTNVSISDILTVPDSPVKTNCASSCDPANQQIQACADNDACLCANETVTALYNCEECMFQFLINENQKMPSFQAGSNPIMTSYAMQCQNLSFTYPTTMPLALSVPSGWNGPVGIDLGMPGTVFGVMFATGWAISALYILSNM